MRTRTRRLVPVGTAPGTRVDGVSGDKHAYDTAFVLLAAAGVAAGRPGADELFESATGVLDSRYWSEEDGLARDVCSRDWTATEDYRGANANMHLVEAFLAAGDVTDDPVWHRRALRIAERLVHHTARGHGWRLPEHFDVAWRPLPDYHRDQPHHPFRPPGATIGHGLEWSRLLVHLHLALPDPPSWLLADAREYYRASVADGWAVDGADGFVYTVDFDGTPLVRQRMHWVVAEAIGAAAVLHRVLGEPEFADDLARWWAYADRRLIDHQRGSWRHELDPRNRPSAQIWVGKPDIYHAYQAALLTASRPGTDAGTQTIPFAGSGLPRGTLRTQIVAPRRTICGTWRSSTSSSTMRPRTPGSNASGGRNARQIEFFFRAEAPVAAPGRPPDAEHPCTWGSGPPRRPYGGDRSGS